MPDPRLPTLSVRAYSRLEKLARQRASYPAIRCFTPKAFERVGFPTRVSHEMELRRYADIMCEISDRDRWLKRVGFSAAEQTMILGLRAAVSALTVRLFEREVEPFLCLFPSTPIMRVIESVARRLGRRLRIMEIGPGAGTLGGYCLLRGHQYIAVEPTHALYLWQHRLFRWLTSGDLVDLAERDSVPAEWPEAQATLIPWWHFAEMFRAQSQKGVDIVVCEAAMGEMDQLALRYVIHLSKLLLKSSDAGLFLFQTVGEEHFSPHAFVTSRLAAHGFQLFECGSVHVHSVSSPRFADLLDRMNEGAPAIDADESALTPAFDFLQMDPSKLSDSYAFFDFLRLDLG